MNSQSRTIFGMQTRVKTSDITLDSKENRHP